MYDDEDEGEPLFLNRHHKHAHESRDNQWNTKRQCSIVFQAIDDIPSEDEEEEIIPTVTRTKTNSALDLLIQLSEISSNACRKWVQQRITSNIIQTRLLGYIMPKSQTMGRRAHLDLRNALKKFDEPGEERSAFQKTAQDLFTQAALRTIYGSDYWVMQRQLLEDEGVESLRSEICVSTPRRFGKTTSVAQWVAAFLYVVPGKHITNVYSPGKRASCLLLRKVVDIARKYLPGFSSMMVRCNEETLELRGPCGVNDIRILNSYPQKMSNPIRDISLTNIIGPFFDKAREITTSTDDPTPVLLFSWREPVSKDADNMPVAQLAEKMFRPNRLYSLTDALWRLSISQSHSSVATLPKTYEAVEYIVDSTIQTSLELDQSGDIVRNNLKDRSITESRTYVRNQLDSMFAASWVGRWKEYFFGPKTTTIPKMLIGDMYWSGSMWGKVAESLIENGAKYHPEMIAVDLTEQVGGKIRRTIAKDIKDWDLVDDISRKIESAYNEIPIPSITEKYTSEDRINVAALTVVVIVINVVTYFVAWGDLLDSEPYDGGATKLLEWIRLVPIMDDVPSSITLVNVLGDNPARVFDNHGLEPLKTLKIVQLFSDFIERWERIIQYLLSRQAGELRKTGETFFRKLVGESESVKASTILYEWSEDPKIIRMFAEIVGLRVLPECIRMFGVRQTIPRRTMAADIQYSLTFGDTLGTQEMWRRRQNLQKVLDILCTGPVILQTTNVFDAATNLTKARSDLTSLHHVLNQQKGHLISEPIEEGQPSAPSIEEEEEPEVADPAVFALSESDLLEEAIKWMNNWAHHDEILIPLKETHLWALCTRAIKTKAGGSKEIGISIKNQPPENHWSEYNQVVHLNIHDQSESGLFGCILIWKRTTREARIYSMFLKRSDGGVPSNIRNIHQQVAHKTLTDAIETWKQSGAPENILANVDGFHVPIIMIAQSENPEYDQTTTQAIFTVLAVAIMRTNDNMQNLRATYSVARLREYDQTNWGEIIAHQIRQLSPTSANIGDAGKSVGMFLEMLMPPSQPHILAPKRKFSK